MLPKIATPPSRETPELNFEGFQKVRFQPVWAVFYFQRRVAKTTLSKKCDSCPYRRIRFRNFEFSKKPRLCLPDRRYWNRYRLSILRGRSVSDFRDVVVSGFRRQKGSRQDWPKNAHTLGKTGPFSHIFRGRRNPGHDILGQRIAGFRQKARPLMTYSGSRFPVSINRTGLSIDRNA